ncbi:MAG: CotH kinase family protein [Bacteroidota bacterium]
MPSTNLNRILIGLLLCCIFGCDLTHPEVITTPILYLNILTKEGDLAQKNTRIILRETPDSLSIAYEGKMKRRGGFSIGFPKHSFEIDLKEDVSIAQLPADDDWILNANYIDKTFLRHVVCYELFSAMGASNLASKCSYVEVDINGSYSGLYVLMEKLDKSGLAINDEDSLAFIFKEPHIFRASYENVTPQHVDNFHQQTFPKIKKNDKRATIEGIRDFILNSDEPTFQEHFPQLFDMENIIDWHLLLLISNNGDGILKNFYLYKQDSLAPIRVAPWDYDHSFGRDGDNELNLDERPLDIHRSILFDRLLQSDWYTSQLKERWTHLNRQDILSVEGLKQRILQKADALGEAVGKNAERWPFESKHYFDANTFDQEIDIMLQFIDLRHNRLSTYFESL